MCLCIYFIVHSTGKLSFPFIILPPPLLFLSLPSLPSSPTFFFPDATSDIQMFMYLVHLNMKHGKLDFYFYFAHPTPVSCLIHNSESSTLNIAFLRNKIIFVFLWGWVALPALLWTYICHLYSVYISSSNLNYSFSLVNLLKLL